MNFRKSKPGRKRLVIIHHEGMKESLEGVWDGSVVAGHYPITGVSIVLPNDRKSTIAGEALIPAHKVAFIQVLGYDESV